MAWLTTWTVDVWRSMKCKWDAYKFNRDVRNCVVSYEDLEKEDI